MKRTFDIFIAIVSLILLFPLIALTATVVRICLGSPVFFVQERPGRNERPFHMVKFRTMRDEIDANGRSLEDAARLTRIGRVLRANSLDELPELWNVLKGDMSLVGPRPLLMEYIPLYDARQRRRHEVRPGITGWAQVNGRNALSWEDRFELDVWYVENQSFWLDIRILCLTVWKVTRREGVSQPGHATMEKFKGNDVD